MSTYKHYFAAESQLRKMGLSITRAELISEFTSGRKSSLKELSSVEYADLVQRMNTMLGRQRSADKLNDQRRKVIALLCKMGYVTPDGLADMTRIQAWCVSHGHAHVTLNEYDAITLPRLVTQVEIMYKKFLQAL